MVEKNSGSNRISGSWERIEISAVVGTCSTCDVKLKKARVSRRHCVVHKTAQGYLVEDLNSRNGTYVRGKKIHQKLPVAEGEKITLGRTHAFPWEQVLRYFEKTKNRNGSAERSHTITIGRNQANDIVPSDLDVSNWHAKVIFGSKRTYIEDVGSRNGTYLNSKHSPVTRARLRLEDVIYLGNTRLLAKDIFKKSLDSKTTPVLPDNYDAFKTALGITEPVAHGLLNLRGKQGSFFLGRGEDCDFVLPYPMVSLRHAKITVCNQTGITVDDLGSSNGTFVNGERIIRKIRIRPGDCIALGPVWFVLSNDGLSLELATRKGEIVLEGQGITIQLAGGKKILDDVSVAVLPGELVGLMGPSGSGKSTLISALNGYCSPVSGNVTINGRDLYEHYDEFRGMIGYVPQDDIMHADLTVQEALYFSARLRLPTDYSEDEIGQRLQRVINDLGLEGTEHTRIGNAERRGLSGGQRKRVNVAMELLTDPPLVFLDEPTSGLSSEDALSLMKLMRKLVVEGKTIILTIHQPSLEVYRLMDNLIVVGKDSNSASAGQLVFSGPAFPDAITFFQGKAKDGTDTSPDGVLRGLATRPASEWASKYRKSDYYQRFVANRLQDRSEHDYKNLASRRRVGGLSQYKTLVTRGLRIKLKDSWNTGVLLLQAPLIAIVLGLVFGPTLSEEVVVGNFADVSRATATTMFLLGFSALWFGCSNAARDIVAERAIYKRERMVGLTVPAYVASKFTILAILCSLQCGILLFIVGWLGSLRASWLFLFGAIFLAALVGVTIGLLVSAVARTSEVAAGVLPLVILPMVILGGVLLPLHDLPRGPIPMHVIAGMMPSRWAFESLLLPEADARPRLDADVVPPRIVPGSESRRRESEQYQDIAEVFFKRIDRFSSPSTLPLLVLSTQVVIGLGCVTILLLRQDTV